MYTYIYIYINVCIHTFIRIHIYTYVLWPALALLDHGLDDGDDHLSRERGELYVCMHIYMYV